MPKILAPYGALLDAVRGVRWPARRPVAGHVTGAHQSRARGTTAEFTEFRAYRQGDDPKKIDWKLLARSDRAYIRLATERALLPTMVIVDASASMAYPTRTLDKWRLARELAVALAAIAHAGGDPVGMTIVSGDTVSRLPARSRRGIVSEMMHLLDRATPGGSPELAPVALAARTARIAIVSDLLGDVAALIRVAGLHVASGGEVHVAHVIAADELNPPAGARLVVDPERSSQMTERMLSDETRAGYIERFTEWRTETARRVRATGASYVEAVTSESVSRLARRVAEPPGMESRR